MYKEVSQMKQLSILLRLSIVMIVPTVFFACSSTSEKTKHDEYVVPVNQIVQQKADTGNLFIFRERSVTPTDNSLKDTLIGMFRQQNSRMEDVVQQLHLLTNKENSDNSKNTGNLNELLATRDRISYEMLLEMVRDQNQRLNDVIEQLKLLSQNQSASRSNPTEHADVVPAQQVPVQQVPVHQVPVSKHLVASWSYGKAIQLYQNREYKKAIHAFKKLLNRKIEPKLADRYHFWMGVCYFHLNCGSQAINEFTKVLGYSNSDKAESAYFMIGQCYECIGAKKYATMAFEKMLQVYPRGSLKQITETKLALLK
jgi:TolA-binding protein